MAKVKIIICGGGTGGHLFPAIAVGQKLKSINPDIELLYAGGYRDLERKIVENHGYKFVPFRIEGLKGVGLTAKFRSLILVLGAFPKSFSLLKKFQPDLVIGAGGYSSGPLVLLASWLKIPTVILEQNSVPGFTNKLLGRWVRSVIVSFPSTLRFFSRNGILLGNPVREEFERVMPKPDREGLDLLVFGGSQGSHFLNTLIADTLPLLQPEKERLRMTHQTGNNDHDWIATKYEQTGFDRANVSAFIPDMWNAFAQADLIICRAGATSIAELVAAQKASILVPFSRATGDHQTKNALELKNIGGAEILSEEEATPERLASKIIFFLNNKGKLQEMARRLRVLKKEGAARKIAEYCLCLISTGAGAKTET